jgi:hypothetical protein
MSVTGLQTNQKPSLMSILSLYADVKQENPIQPRCIVDEVVSTGLPV